MMRWGISLATFIFLLVAMSLTQASTVRNETLLDNSTHWFVDITEGLGVHDNDKKSNNSIPNDEENEEEDHKKYNIKINQAMNIATTLLKKNYRININEAIAIKENQNILSIIEPKKEIKTFIKVLLWLLVIVIIVFAGWYIYQLI